MILVCIAATVAVYAKYKLSKDDNELDYRRALPIIEARLDQENARLDREIAKLLREHRKLCAKE